MLFMLTLLCGCGDLLLSPVPNCTEATAHSWNKWELAGSCTNRWGDIWDRYEHTCTNCGIRQGFVRRIL
jgi:hypothetical protein